MFEISRQYELSVLVNGNPVTEYSHDNNVFVEGREGSDFAISFHNKSYENVEVILALDGLSVLDGKEAGPDGPGFLIKAHERQVIKGWTVSHTEAKSFFFAGKGEGYSSKSASKGKNTGVIGAMVFRPKQYARKYTPVILENNFPFNPLVGGQLRGVEAFYGEAPTGLNMIAKASASAAPSNGIEAGWGSSIQQNLTEVSFERRDPLNPDAILAMFYDDRKGLERRGIVLDRTKMYSDPFPGYTNSRRIGCEPPKS